MPQWGLGAPGRDASDDAVTAQEDLVDLKLGHYNKDGIEVVDVEGEIDVYTAQRLRELLIDLVNKKNYHLVVNMEKVEFLDSTGLGVLVGGLKRVRAHDGSLDLVESGLRYGTRGHSHVREGVEVGRRGISDETFQGPGPARCNSAGPPA